MKVKEFFKILKSRIILVLSMIFSITMLGYFISSNFICDISLNAYTVCVKYEEYLINLAISSCPEAYVVVNGQKSTAVQIDSSDIFRESMRNFVAAIEMHELNKDMDKFTKSIAVILAVKESMEKGAEVKIR